jgi:hypothetical protein
MTLYQLSNETWKRILEFAWKGTESLQQESPSHSQGTNQGPPEYKKAHRSAKELQVSCRVYEWPTSVWIDP